LIRSMGKGFFPSTEVQTGSGAHPASAFYSVGTWILSWGESAGGVKLTTHRHLVPRLRMIGAVTLLPLYAFMSLDLYFFFTVFVPFSPNFPACHPLLHSFFSAHFP
jgi:hypothetical protein